MESYIGVPRDLTKVKSKVAFNLTKRQLVCFSLAAMIGVPVYFFLKKGSGNTGAAAMGMMSVMMPLFFFAMYERNGEPLEVMLFHFIEWEFLRPKIRIYRTDNDYALLEKLAEAEKEAEHIVRKYKKISFGVKKRIPNSYEYRSGRQKKTSQDHEKSDSE